MTNLLGEQTKHPLLAVRLIRPSPISISRKPDCIVMYVQNKLHMRHMFPNSHMLMII